MEKTVLGSNSARGKKNRKNMRKLTPRYPQIQAQMRRRRMSTGLLESFLALAAGFGTAGAAATGGAVVAATGTTLAGLSAGFSGSAMDLARVTSRVEIFPETEAEAPSGIEIYTVGAGGCQAKRQNVDGAAFNAWRTRASRQAMNVGESPTAGIMRKFVMPTLAAASRVSMLIS